jgi:hypothetical protein
MVAACNSILPFLPGHLPQQYTTWVLCFRVEYNIYIANLEELHCSPFLIVNIASLTIYEISMEFWTVNKFWLFSEVHIWKSSYI